MGDELRHQQSGEGNILDSLDDDNPPPPILVRKLASHSHFNEKLSETDELEHPCYPCVSLVLVAPSAGVFGMERERKNGLPLGITLHDPRK